MDTGVDDLRQNSSVAVLIDRKPTAAVAWVTSLQQKDAVLYVDAADFIIVQSPGIAPG